MREVDSDLMFNCFLDKYISKSSLYQVYAVEGINRGYSVLYGSRGEDKNVIIFNTNASYSYRIFSSLELALKDWFFEGRKILIFKSMQEFMEYAVENPNSSKEGIMEDTEAEEG